MGETPQSSPEATADTAKKYIRTFASDMAALEKGSALELEPQSTPAERLVAASPVTQIQTPIPAPIPTPEPELLPIPELTKPTPIKTYADDFSGKMKEEHASAATVLAAEQDAAAGKVSLSQPVQHSRSNILYTIAGAVLLIAGGLGVYITYTRHLASIAPVIFAPSITAPIFVDEREQISGVGPILLQAIEQSLTRPLAPGTIRLLYTAFATTSDNSVFSALQEPAPNIILRNVNAEGSMAGVINIGGVQSPFFIFSVASYGDTFSGMLFWETLMPRDLAQLFPPYPASIVSTSTATSTIATSSISSPRATIKATTTKTATTSPSAPKISAGFRDEVVGNHDVRIYRDTVGRSILLYGYWDQATLIIARDPSAFAEILNRLATSRAQHSL